MSKTERQKRIEKLVKEILECEEEIPNIEYTDEHNFEDIPDISDEELEIQNEAMKIAYELYLSQNKDN